MLFRSGFGTVKSATALNLSISSIAINNLETNIVAGAGTSPFIHAYIWDNSTGFGTKFANPSTLPSAASSYISLSF